VRPPPRTAARIAVGTGVTPVCKFTATIPVCRSKDRTKRIGRLSRNFVGGALAGVAFVRMRSQVSNCRAHVQIPFTFSLARPVRSECGRNPPARAYWKRCRPCCGRLEIMFPAVAVVLALSRPPTPRLDTPPPADDEVDRRGKQHRGRSARPSVAPFASTPRADAATQDQRSVHPLIRPR
jgi:hypothetical protein